ncbi:MAG: hypothetical protein ACC645_07800 [Pirellulales bacterium]
MMQQPQQQGNEWSGNEPESERQGQSESSGAPEQGRTSGSTALDSKTYLSDRRAWPRTRSDIGQITLWTSTTDYQVVEVHDESLTGLAILVGDVSQLTVNREVRLAFSDSQMWAIVRHIHPASEGVFLVGLEWGCSDGRFLSGNG